MQDEREHPGEDVAAYYDAEGHDDHGAFGDYDEADIVEWYEARPVTLSAVKASGALLAAFALGAVTAVAAVALIRRYED